MKTFYFLISISLAIVIFNLGKIDHERKHGAIKIEHIENVDEMEETPIELVVWVNGIQYKYNTETGEQTQL